MKLRYKLPFFNWLAQLFQKVSGIPPLTLPRAVAGGLKEVTAYGGTSLAGGLGVPPEYVALSNLGKYDASSYTATGLIPDDTFGFHLKIKFPGDITTDQVKCGIRETDGSAKCYVGVSASKIYVGWGGAQDPAFPLREDRPVISSATFVDLKVNYLNDRKIVQDDVVLYSGLPTITQSFSHSFPLFARWYGNQFDASEYRRAEITVAEFTRGTEVIATMIPVERLRDGTLGMYDLTRTLFFPNSAANGSFTAGSDAVPSPDNPMDIVCNNGVIKRHIDAEGWSLQNGTPSPDNPIEIQNYTQGNMILRGIGDYKDVYNSSTKTITRKIGVKVFDGTEDWLWSDNANAPARLTVPETISVSHTDNAPFICSHFESTFWDNLTISTRTIPYIAVNQTTNASVRRMVFTVRWNENITDLESWKQFLADQYSAGTPVVVYYPLATETTETWNDVVYMEGVQETIAVGNSSASAEYLLKTTSYGRTFTDQHDLVRGTVLRNCQIFVVTGQESTIAYVDSPTTQASRFRLSLSNMYYLSGVSDGSPCLTSHFEGKLARGAYGTCYSYRTNIMFLWTYGATTQEFKTWLAAQYAAGTPVIVIYPLATPVVEHVNPQALNTVAGTNTLEITQASLAGLELKAEYKRH